MITFVNRQLPIDTKLVICYSCVMSEQELTHQILKITWPQKEALRKIALQYGLTIGRGNEKNMGSINQLAALIANGDLIVVKPSTDNGR